MLKITVKIPKARLMSLQQFQWLATLKTLQCVCVKTWKSIDFLFLPFFAWFLCSLFLFSFLYFLFFLALSFFVHLVFCCCWSCGFLVGFGFGLVCWFLLCLELVFYWWVLSLVWGFF